MRCHICGWFKPSASPARLSIRSVAHSVLWHWVEGIGNARCQVADCALCSVLPEPLETQVFIVERGGSFFLFELNASLLSSPLVVGDSIVVTRRRTKGFVETFVRRDGHEPAQEMHAPAYIAALGQKLYDRAVLSLQCN